MNLVDEAKNVFQAEIDALEQVKEAIDDDFSTIVSFIVNCKGKFITTGIGKSGHIGRKIAATMSSLGTPSFFLHPAEALHGDLGMVTKEDVVLIISFSGESEEIVRILPNIRMIGATIIGLSGNKNSTLIKYSDAYQIFPPIQEACSLGLAPTSSTTAALVYGDTLAIVCSKIYGFKEDNFGLFHPAGTLGKRLLITTSDLMYCGDENPTVRIGSTLKSAVVEMSKKGYGMVSIIDEENNVVGIITDGDLRRLLEKGVDIYSLMVNEVLTSSPMLLDETLLAVESLKRLQNRRVTIAPVINNKKKLIGCISVQKILESGIVI